MEVDPYDDEVIESIFNDSDELLDKIERIFEKYWEANPDFGFRHLCIFSACLTTIYRTLLLIGLDKREVREFIQDCGDNIRKLMNKDN